MSTAASSSIPEAPSAVRGKSASRGGGSGVPLLDEYWATLDDALYVMGRRHVSINPRLYLIWKLQRYCTPHHQDVHVPPHFTLYNQVSGASSFHFFRLVVLVQR